MPSVLVVDTARLGHSWLRPLSNWADALASLLPDDCPFLAVGVANIDLHNVEFPMGIAMRSSISERDRALVTPVDDLWTSTSVGLIVPR